MYVQNIGQSFLNGWSLRLSCMHGPLCLSSFAKRLCYIILVRVRFADRGTFIHAHVQKTACVYLLVGYARMHVHAECGSAYSETEEHGHVSAS